MTTKSQEALKLTVQKRDIFGKKVKKLRKEGVIPANIYGEDIASQAISIPNIEFAKLFRKSGATQVIHLVLKKDDIPAIVHHVQRHPVSDQILHIDFRKVNLSKKIQTGVPIKYIGEAPAVENKKGDLITSAETVLIEALPTDIPTKIEIDISTLIEPGDEIRIQDLKAKGGYVIIDDPEKTLVHIIAHKEEEITPELPPAEVVEETEVGTKTKEETESPAEPSQQTEEQKTQESKQKQEKE